MGVKKRPGMGRFVTIEKIYERIIYYKDKSDLSFMFNEYHRAVLDNNTVMSFVSPSGYSLIRKYDGRSEYYTTVLEYDEVITLLKTYSRKKKLKWIMIKNKIRNEKERRTS